MIDSTLVTAVGAMNDNHEAVIRTASSSIDLPDQGLRADMKWARIVTRARGDEKEQHCSGTAATEES